MWEAYRAKGPKPNGPQNRAGTAFMGTEILQEAGVSLRRNLGHAAEIGLGNDAGVLGVPLRAGAAHVVALGMIAVEQLTGHGEPEVSHGLADARCFFSLGCHD